MNENKTILVTGGAGAIGSNLVNTIIDDCEKIVILDDFSSGRSDNLENLNSEKVYIVNGDICNQFAIDEAFSYGINQVYHLAANFANQNSVDNTEKDLRTNSFVIGVQVAQRAGIVPADLMTKIKEIDSKWTQTYKVVTMSDSEKTALNSDIASSERNERNFLLAETDWMAGSDITISDAWKTYRQALRDLPTTSGWPTTHTWPTKPS